MMTLQERLKEVNWKHAIIIGLILVLAFGIRAYLLRYDLLFEFDTYWHTRMTGEIIQHGALPQVDPLAYYQKLEFYPDGSPVPLQTELFWYISAFFYSLVALITTGSLAYNKELLIQVVKFLPAFYGTVVVLGLYLLGKEAYGRRAGYLMAFFGAVSSSFIYRSMAGFFEAGTLGYVFLIFGFYFTLRAVKRMQDTKAAVINGLIAGIILAAMSEVYAFFVIIPFLLLFYLIFSVLAFLGRNEKEQAIRFAQVVIGIFAVFFSITFFLDHTNWFFETFNSITGVLTKNSSIIPFAIIAGIIFLCVVLFFFIKRNKLQKEHSVSAGTIFRWIKIALLFLLLVISVFAMLVPKERKGISAISVGEESPGYLYFFHKFSALIILPVLALLLIPIIDFKRKSVDSASMLLFPFILLSLYLAWDRLHYSYNMGVPLAIGAGYIVHHALIFFQRRTRSERAFAGVLLGFMIVIGVASATLFTQNNTPTIEVDTGWKEGLQWLKNNTPADAKMFNWWDEGHWITFLAERKVITDNRNFDQHANSDVAKFILTPDLNEAVAILKKYDSDYITLGADLFSRRNSMLLYAYYLDHPEQFQSTDPRVDFVPSFEFPCDAQKQANGATVYQCGGNTIPEAELNSLPIRWTNIPSAIRDGRNPLFYYRTPDNAHIYVLSAKENDTIFAKIWFAAPDVAPFFQEVFPDELPQYKNKELKIFKINKERLATVH